MERPARLPFVISVPHVGNRVPPEVDGLTELTRDAIIADGDEGAAEIFLPLRDLVSRLVTTEIARTFVDVNRPADDLHGVTQPHTRRGEAVYRRSPDARVRATLLERYHGPYHRALVEGAAVAQLGLDCHTTAARGCLDGSIWPLVCLGDAGGRSCPPSTVTRLAACLEQTFGAKVVINEPFSAGHITRSRPGGIPWIQITLSGEPWTTPHVKSRLLATALLLLHHGTPGIVEYGSGGEQLVRQDRI
jgi:N-formylglutamate amidohydrolase